MIFEYFGLPANQKAVLVHRYAMITNTVSDMIRYRVHMNNTVSLIIHVHTQNSNLNTSQGVLG